MATGMFDNDASGLCLQQSPGVPSSPASIPLPDSLPPEDSEGILEQEEEKLEGDEDEDPNSSSQPHYNNHDPPINNVAPRTGRGSRKSSSGSRKPRLIEEYDPSEPLTSSDEEEHSIQLIEGEVSPEFRLSYNELTPSETNNSSNNLVRVSKTPPPPPIISSSKQTPPFSISPSKQPPQVTIIPPNLDHVFTPTSVNYNNGSGNSNSIRIDLGSSGSTPSDDKRRPVIHFSIPTRHRLLPISTLIKNQKRNARMGGKGDGLGGGNFDPTRASDKLLDGEEDDEDGEETPKISLVAEIFGGDDDDDEEEEEVENKTDGAAQPQTAKSQGKDTLTEQEGEGGDPEPFQGDGSTLSVTEKGQLMDANSGRWKIVDNELSLPPVTTENNSSETITEQDIDTELNNELPKATSAPEGNSTDGEKESAAPSQEDEPEIIEIVTINVPSSNRLRPLRRRPFLSRYGMENGGEPEVIDIDKDEDDVPVEPPKRIEEPAPAPPPPVVVEEPVPVIDPIPEPPIDPATPPSTPPPPANIQVIVERAEVPEVRPERRRVVSGSEPERHRRSYSRSRSAERERPHFKRPHSSSSVSNCEEGEIVDQVNPNKKRKKDKKRKMKKRKKSRDSMTPPPKSSSEKKSSEVGTSAASDKEENSSRSAISWRKPSKRTQNRNYRDGKPKADDTFFRERDAEERQRRSNSPSHKRNRGSTRKEKSPVGNKSSSKHKRDAPETLARPSSKSPSRIASESRSKGGGAAGAYLGRRRHRRSRSNSSSSGRSISRRRSSRRRYRRSTSRHHPGDSRSPSYITELIRSRSSNLPKLSDRSRSRSRDRHARGRHRKSSLSRSRSHSPVISGHRKNRKAESSSDRQHKKKQLKEKQIIEETNAENKEKRKERERLKEREKEKRTKKKEKTLEENKKEQKEKEKVKEKEKKKKRKRREKSPTPVKAIVADGDSIVVSLSFSKGKTATTTSNAQSRASTEDHSKDHHHNGLQTAETTESSNNQHPHVNGNDGTERNATIEDSHHHHHHHHHHDPQSSPSKSADDNDSATPNDTAQATDSSKGKKVDEKETETIKVTSSGGGSCGSRSPFETENSCSAVADSTKVIHSQQVEQYESSFSHSGRSPSMSPTDVESSLQGDSLVTSTGDTMDLSISVEEDSSKLNSSGTPSKQTDSSKLFSGMAHKPSANMSPRGTQASTSSCTSAESSNTPSATTSHASTSAGGSSQNFPSTSTPHSRPLIGNIPGLYPSSAINSSGGAAPVPPPIVIPTPPPPQGSRFSGGNPSTPMLNPNVLASVASALLAVRQNQPAGSGKTHASGGSGSISDSSNMQLRHMNVLGPKSQNFTIQSNMRNSSGGNNYTEEQGGDSPMSPNSSEGDDLFEPPTDRSQSGQGANAGNNKGGKNVQQLFGNPNMLPPSNPIDNFNSAGHANKERNIFDTLFESGPDIKKSTVAKPEKMTKTKQQKLRKGGAGGGGGGPKKETIKVNTSGGLTKGELRLADEVPTSAVELIVKQKYLKKLNRQERVVEEVKLSLKPHYSKRHINKDEYKEILRRAVPKICHNKTGEINPGKIKELVEAYVKKFRHARKRGLDMSSIK